MIRNMRGTIFAVKTDTHYGPARSEAQIRQLTTAASGAVPSTCPTVLATSTG
jgi:hypothetical protein